MVRRTHGVIVEVVFVAVKLAANAQTGTHKRIHVVVVVVVMTSIVILHTIRSVDKEVIYNGHSVELVVAEVVMEVSIPCV
jgi:hypothetical protein